VLDDIWIKPHSKHWAGVGPRYASLQLGNTVGSLESPFDGRYYSATHESLNMKYYTPRHPEHLLPPLKYTMDDALKIAEPKTNVIDYVEQSIAEFVASIRDINNDAHWNGYLRELENLGLKVWLDAAQSTYNRQRR
jgi:hypothetical protein